MGIDKEGNFVVPGIVPGKYLAFLFRPGMRNQGLYLARMTWNGQKVAGGAFEVSGAGDGRMELEIEESTARVVFSAPPEAERAMLFQIPMHEVDMMRGMSMGGALDQAGMTELRDLVPGVYFACALGTQVGTEFVRWVNDAGNRATVERHCEKVEVPAKGEVQVRVGRVLQAPAP